MAPDAQLELRHGGRGIAGLCSFASTAIPPPIYLATFVSNSLPRFSLSCSWGNPEVEARQAQGAPGAARAYAPFAARITASLHDVACELPEEACS